MSLNHESNGTDGINDRSTARLITTGEFGNPEKTNLYCSISFWTYLQKGKHNMDIASYAGMGEIKVNWQHTTPGKTTRLGTSIATHFAYSRRTFSNVELNVFVNHFYGMKGKFKWMPTLMAQYFYGTGENLLNYNKETSNLRIGLAFVH